jgi:predicted HicB family RNase H-like nuclease
METKTLKISEPIHSQLRVSAAQQKQSIQSLAESFITTGLSALLARKQAETGNPLRLRK